MAKAVRERVERVRKLGDPVDHLTFVPDGEPTLDLHLGRTIELLRPLRVPIAVLSNGSLLWQPDVRHDLASVDWVSIKVDSVSEAVWRAHNRPDASLSLREVLEGMQHFAADARGALVTETMLVRGSNDSLAELEATADFVATLSPATAYLSLPVRPPCEPWVEPPDVHWVEYACEVFGQRVGRVELLDEHDARLAAKCGRLIDGRDGLGGLCIDRTTRHRGQYDGS
jgi:wyosine [tRNA(Phe)-imidazoG37] synthetase (radical SAM superfamily)